MTATAKTFLYGWKFNKFGLNLQNKHLQRWISTTKHHLPDYSFARFNTASRCQHHIRAKHVFCDWKPPGKCQQTALCCPSSPEEQWSILLLCFHWPKDITWYRPWAETTVAPVGCGLL